MKLLGITGPTLKLIQCFLNSRLQRVVLNGHSSSWTPVFAGVLQGSVLGPPFFLIYINDIAEVISSTTKLTADDTSLFSVVNNIDESANQMNMVLEKISPWAYHGRCLSTLTSQSRLRKLFFQKKCKCFTALSLL